VGEAGTYETGGENETKEEFSEDKKRIASNCKGGVKKRDPREEELDLSHIPTGGVSKKEKKVWSNDYVSLEKPYTLEIGEEGVPHFIP